MKRITKSKILIFIALASVVLQGFYLKPMVAYANARQTTDLAEQLTNEVDNQLTKIDFSEIEILVSEIENNTNPIVSIDNLTETIKTLVSGDSVIEYENVLGVLFNSVLSCVKKYIPLMLFIMATTIACSLLGKLKNKNNEKTLNDITNFVCMTVVIVAIGSCLKNLIATTSHTITSIKSQMSAVFPILLTLTTAIGSAKSVGLYKPAVALLSTGVAELFASFVLPLFILSVVFIFVGNLSNSIKLDKINGFISSLFKWVVGVTFTIFFAIISIQGISANSFDGISIRTAKFTLRSYVPIMGGYLSEGFDLILSSSLLIKNGVGMIGIIMLISTILNPILEIAIFSLILKFACAIMQPLADGKVVKMLDGVSKSLNILNTVIIVLAFMYFLMVGMIMSTASGLI